MSALLRLARLIDNFDVVLCAQALLLPSQTNPLCANSLRTIWRWPGWLPRLCILTANSTSRLHP